MTITYTWDFLKFNAHPTLNSMNNVIYNVEFILNGSDGEGHAAQVFNTVGLGEPDPANFIEFSNLTTSTVISMVTDALGNNLANYQAIINSQIQSQIAPATASLAPPWQPSGLVFPE